jgi:hypothetical protein
MRFTASGSSGGGAGLIEGPPLAALSNRALPERIFDSKPIGVISIVFSAVV